MEKIVFLETGPWCQNVEDCWSRGSRFSSDTRSAGALVLDFQPPELWEVNVYCLSPQSMVLCYSSLNWLKQTGDVVMRCWTHFTSQMLQSSYTGHFTSIQLSLGWPNQEKALVLSLAFRLALMLILTWHGPLSLQNMKLPSIFFYHYFILINLLINCKLYYLFGCIRS